MPKALSLISFISVGQTPNIIMDKLELQKLVKSYNETEGITADSVEGDNKEVIYIEEIDYNEFTGELKEENIYSKGVKASVIKFKNESEGFTCNG